MNNGVGMAPNTLSKTDLTFRPVTTREWADLQALFAEPGVQSGCWCMYWRIKRADYHRRYGADNKNAMRQIIEAGRVPGILAYLDDRPIAWCSIAPREAFPVLDRSPTLKRIDDRPVWSIVCFFVARRHRRQGLTQALIQAAITYAKERGAGIIEAYPLIPGGARYPRYEQYTGVLSTYEKAGFNIAKSRTPPRVR